MAPKLLTILGRSLRVYVKPPLQRISIGLGILAAKNAGCSSIYAANPIRRVVELAMDALGLEMGVKDCSDVRDDSVLLWCSSVGRPLLVAGPELRQPSKYGLERMTVKHIRDDIYLLNVPRGGLREYVKLNGYIPVPAEPPCRRDLMDAITAAAKDCSVTLRDAVDIVSATLSIKRGEARRLILELIEQGCLEIDDNGFVKITGY